MEMFEPAAVRFTLETAALTFRRSARVERRTELVRQHGAALPLRKPLHENVDVRHVRVVRHPRLQLERLTHDAWGHVRVAVAVTAYPRPEPQDGRWRLPSRAQVRGARRCAVREVVV